MLFGLRRQLERLLGFSSSRSRPGARLTNRLKRHPPDVQQYNLALTFQRIRHPLRLVGQFVELPRYAGATLMPSYGTEMRASEAQYEPVYESIGHRAARLDTTHGRLLLPLDRQAH